MTITVANVENWGSSIPDAACRHDEKAAFFAFEESSHQIVRNKRPVGIDLEPWVDVRALSLLSSLYGRIDASK